MVQKPPVDIEWYDDGFSIEEQGKLKKAYNKAKVANRPKIKVTEKYHERTKDKIISDLRQKLAADEEYIKELEEGSETSRIVKELQQELKFEIERSNNYKVQYSELNKKYVALLENPELGVQKYRDTIKELEVEVKSLKEIRDHLIYMLSTCSQ